MNFENLSLVHLSNRPWHRYKSHLVSFGLFDIEAYRVIEQYPVVENWSIQLWNLDKSIEQHPKSLSYDNKQYKPFPIMSKCSDKKNIELLSKIVVVYYRIGIDYSDKLNQEDHICFDMDHCKLMLVERMEKSTWTNELIDVDFLLPEMMIGRKIRKIIEE